ncbi:MAG TPA: DUF4149 domain-containing protein [Gammaproteobacteria bacterium]|nr:DUF4149 domain-containing protein [Gammaproteobacteria bacterium]
MSKPPPAAEGMTRFRGIGERILLTLWVGSLWAVGYLAVPVLFHALDDRALAGELAGQMFRIVNGLGVACGALLLVSAFTSGLLRQERGRTIVIAVMTLLAGVMLFVIQPQMQSIKAEAALAGAGLGPEFARLHGLSSALYLGASLLGLWLVAGYGSRRAA